jgi:hypothetical protein
LTLGIADGIALVGPSPTYDNKIQDLTIRREAAEPPIFEAGRPGKNNAQFISQKE